jgi:hypothetical protein
MSGRVAVAASRGTRASPRPGGDKALLGGPVAGLEVDLWPEARAQARLGQGLGALREAFDPALAGELGQPQRRALAAGAGGGQPVAGGQGHQQRVVQQVLQVELAGVQGWAPVLVRVGADHGDVDLPVAEPVELDAGDALDQGQRNLRVGCAEGGQGARHQRRVGAVERAHAQSPGVQVAERFKVLLGGAQPFQDRLGMAEQAAAFLAEPHPSSQPVEQVGAGGLLQRQDLPRHRRLGVAEGLSGGGNEPRRATSWKASSQVRLAGSRPAALALTAVGWLLLRLVQDAAEAWLLSPVRP